MEKRNNNEQKKIDNVLYILGLSGAVICCVYLLISKITGFRIENYLYPCLFHTVTGYYCPGCGGTRAVCALFQGHFLISFLEHPFVPACSLRFYLILQAGIFISFLFRFLFNIAQIASCLRTEPECILYSMIGNGKTSLHIQIGMCCCNRI